MQMVHDSFLYLDWVTRFELSEFDRFQTGKFNKLKFQLEEVDLTDGENLTKKSLLYTFERNILSLKIVSQLYTHVASFSAFPARYILEK